MTLKILDLFCGAGGAAMGYHRAFSSAGIDASICGVDIAEQPHYPFDFIQMDALAYVSKYGREYDLIHASPPCQAYSITKSLPNVGEHADLLNETRQALISSQRPYVIENVIGANMPNSIVLCGTMFNLRVFRHRQFESNLLLLQPVHVKHRGTTGAHRGYSRGAEYVCVVGNNYDAKEGYEAMQIDWMTNRAELSQAIPPAYTEYIGRQLVPWFIQLSEV